MSNRLTALQKLEANEHKAERIRLANHRCSVCGEQFEILHLAHRIPKGYADKYGYDVIYHDLNMPLTCADCNCKVLLDPKSHPVETQALVDEIKELL